MAKAGDRFRTTESTWSHPSVLGLCGSQDPVEVIAHRARELVYSAIQKGWSGPPYDPFELADLLGMHVAPCAEVVDARTLPGPRHSCRIEYNPSQPTGRARYSVAHEIAHTLFPDWAEHVRHRGGHQDARPDEWQLEMLCNVAAAELLMPIGSLAWFK